MINIILVQGFCPQKIKITLFPGEFRLNVSVVIAAYKNVLVQFLFWSLGRFSNTPPPRGNSPMKVTGVLVVPFGVINLRIGTA